MAAWKSSRLKSSSAARRTEAHLDLGMLARELAEARQQPALQELARHAQVQHAADPLAADPVHGAAQLVQASSHARQQFGAFLRQRDRARVTAEERHADVGLERLDLRADRGGRDAEFLRRGGEAQVRRHGLEDPQRVQWEPAGFCRHRRRLE